MIKKLSKLTPSSDDKKTIYTDIDVDQKWKHFIYTIEQFCHEFPKRKLENDISKMICLLTQYYETRDPHTYTKH